MIIYLLFGYDFDAMGGINELLEHFTASGDTEAIEKAQGFCKNLAYDLYQLVRIEES